LLAPLAAMFAGEPPSSSKPTKTPVSDDHLHSQAFRRLLLQIGGGEHRGRADRAVKPTYFVVARRP
jgi:hypothetical protein